MWLVHMQDLSTLNRGQPDGRAHADLRRLLSQSLNFKATIPCFFLWPAQANLHALHLLTATQASL